MEKAQFDNEFLKFNLKLIAIDYESDGLIDKPARRMFYNDKVDSFHKSGLITDKQANDWCIPERLVNTRNWL